jgi:predicted DNA-binding transcriptional regulator YafY
VVDPDLTARGGARYSARAMPSDYESGDHFRRVVEAFTLLGETAVGFSTKELAERLGVDQRSAQRYIGFLRNDVGVEFEKTGHRYRIGEGVKLPPMQLDVHQATTVLIALRLLQQMRTDNDPALVTTLARLAQTLRVPVVKRYLEGLMATVERRPAAKERRQVEGVVVEGFAKGQPVEVEYTDGKGRTSKRVLRPYFLEPRAEARTIYVFAHDSVSKEVRPFRLDRIERARLIGETFTVPDNFDIDALVAGSWGIWQGTGEDEVVLRFSAEVAPRVRATLWHQSAKHTDLPGGGVELRLRVVSEVEMRPWVLGWGALVEVVAPPSLREHVADSMRRGAEIYGRP